MKIHIKKQFGNAGENLATEYLQKQGYTILEKIFIANRVKLILLQKIKMRLCL